MRISRQQHIVTASLSRGGFEFLSWREDGYIDKIANDVWLTEKGKKALKDAGK